MNDQRKSVWDRMAFEFPEFIPEYDPTGNWHLIEEIILGGSPAWAGVHKQFKPFPGAKVMDIGANVGMYSIFCALHGASVTAYEADPVTFALLTKAINRMSFPVYAINAAVWTFTGHAPFRGFAQIIDSSFVSHNGTLTAIGGEERQWGQFRDTEWVDCITFSDAIGGTDWDCVKVDIEGAEYQMLLATPMEALRRIKFMFVEFHPWVTEKIYAQTIEKLREVFEFEGLQENGRWSYAYLTRKGNHGH